MTALPRISQSPADPAFVQDPYPFYARARALGPMVWWEDYAMPVATTHDAVHMALRDNRLGREPLTPPDPPEHLVDFLAVDAHSMLELEPPRHTRLRALVLRAFTSRRIAAMAPEIEALAARLVTDLPESGCDLLPAFAEPLPVIVIARLLGVPEEMAPQLLAWSHAMVGMYQAGRTHADEVAANAAARAFSDYLRGYVEARRSTPDDDLISQLIAAEDDGATLSTGEMISTCILLLNAGHEATVHTLGNGIKAVLEHGAQAAVLADPKTAVEEILRFDPPLHFFTRYVYEDMRFQGADLTRGDQIGLLLASANRDEDGFGPDAAVFDPARRPRNSASFGAGIHFCIGAPLARLELVIALRVLLRAKPDLRLADPPRYADIYHFHGLERLDVTY